jgi:hypothetical protein
MLGAAAPFLFAWVVSAYSMTWAILAALVVSMSGLVAMLVLHRDLRRLGVVPPLGARAIKNGMSA